jgi:hypothetical protein
MAPTRLRGGSIAPGLRNTDLEDFFQRHSLYFLIEEHVYQHEVKLHVSTIKLMQRVNDKSFTLVLKLIKMVNQPYIFLPIYNPYYLMSKSMLVHPFLHLILLCWPLLCGSHPTDSNLARDSTTDHSHITDVAIGRPSQPITAHASARQQV